MPSSRRSTDDKEAGLFYNIDNLPVNLPCEVPSFLVQTAEASPDGPAPIGFVAVTRDTHIVKDLAQAFLAVFTALFAVYTAAFASAKDSHSSFFLTFLAMGYPLVMMFLLMSRSNEICLRKEGYYMLLKYKVLVNWENWGWMPGGNVTHIIWLESIFFWFWAFTSISLVIFAVQNSEAFYAENDLQNVNFNKSASVALVVVLQLFVVFRFFYKTLTVEEDGLVSLNKFLENKQGQMDLGPVNEYLGEGPFGSEGIHVVEELDLREYAVNLFSFLPWPYKIDWRLDDMHEYQAELAKWQQAVEGDLMSLHLGSKLSWMGEVNPIAAWFYRRIYGFCLLRVLTFHPDFKVMHSPLRWLLKWHMAKMLACFCVALGLQMYAMWLILNW